MNTTQVGSEKAKAFSVSMYPRLRKQIEECVDRLNPQYKDFSHFVVVAVVEKMKKECGSDPFTGQAAEADDLLSAADEVDCQQEGLTMKKNGGRKPAKGEPSLAERAVASEQAARKIVEQKLANLRAQKRKAAGSPERTQPPKKDDPRG